MRALALCALLALPAAAQEPTLVPSPTCLTVEDQLALAKVLKQREAENAELKKVQGVPVGLVIGTAAGALVLGAAAGVAVAFAVK